MIKIKVWCLPIDQSEEDLNSLHQAIVKSVVSVSETETKNENDMVCLFPADLMKYGLGQEIIIEIDGLPIMLRNDMEVREQLAQFVSVVFVSFIPMRKSNVLLRDLIPQLRFGSQHLIETKGDKRWMGFLYF